MNNKGFTFIELLSIIVIVAILVALAGINISDQIGENEKKEKTYLNESIENAAHLYIAKFHAGDVFVLKNTESIVFELSDLEANGLIDFKSKCQGQLSKKIIVTKNDTALNYDYKNIEGADCYTINQ
ncbi:MAG: type II secretion system protein [Bacilli bacterium]